MFNRLHSAPDKQRTHKFLKYHDRFDTGAESEAQRGEADNPSHTTSKSDTGNAVLPASESQTCASPASPHGFWERRGQTWSGGATETHGEGSKSGRCQKEWSD